MVETRSKAARSRAATLATVSEQPENYDILNNQPGDPSQVEPPTAGDDAAEDARQTEIAERRRQRRVTYSLTNSERARVIRADPNEGRCFLTNRKEPVETCHIVEQRTKPHILKKLEYAWGLGYYGLNIHIEHNLMRLRDDWHTSFDSGRFILIPESDILQQLYKIYVEDELTTSDMRNYFTDRTYKYHVLPLPPFGEPICRFPNVNTFAHEMHEPPYPNLGRLEGHFHPHFVVFNAGRKLDEFAGSRAAAYTRFMMSLPREPDLPPDVLSASMVAGTLDIYTKWKNVEVPKDFYNNGRRSHPSEGGRSDRSQPQGGPPPKRKGLRSATRSGGEESQASGAGYTGGQQRAQLPLDDEDSLTDDDTVYDDSTDWIDDIHSWQEKGAAQRWDPLDVSDDLGDKQLAAYKGEHARTPPSPDVWHSWKPVWGGCRRRCLSASDRSQFSSNDWAVYKRDVYLTRSEF